PTPSADPVYLSRRTTGNGSLACTGIMRMYRTTVVGFVARDGASPTTSEVFGRQNLGRLRAMRQAVAFLRRLARAAGPAGPCRGAHDYVRDPYRPSGPAYARSTFAIRNS